MKKLLFIIIPSIVIAILVYLLILHINYLRSQKGALQVTSSPISKVYLNDKYIGRTPVSKTTAADMITTGNYIIKLIPDDNSINEYQEKITISAGIMTVVDRKFNKDSTPEGYVITLLPLNYDSKTELEVISFPAASKVDLDTNPIGKSPLLFKKPTESDHILNISKEGYSEKTIRIHTPKGYRLTVIAYLSIGNPDLKPAPSQAIASSSATPTASSSSTPTSGPKVLILDTPTGFLRVRQDSNLNSSQISTVTPGQSFPLISEVTDWFEIKLSDGKTGWISSQYAKKL